MEYGLVVLEGRDDPLLRIWAVDVDDEVVVLDVVVVVVVVEDRAAAAAAELDRYPQYDAAAARQVQALDI